MKRLFSLVMIFLATVPFSSCDIDDGVNFRFTALEIVSAEFPDAFDVNETYDIKVTYIRPDNCTFFEGFDFVREEQTTRNIAAIGSVLTDEEDCNEPAEEIVTSFEFKVIYTDTYLFKFWTGEDANGDPQYLEIEVPVNP